MMNIDLLRRCGEALYGPWWQREVARELDVHERTMRHWVAGSRAIPDGIQVDLLRLCVERAEELNELLDILPREGAPR